MLSFADSSSNYIIAHALLPLQSQIYMMEQEKRRMELEVSSMLLHKQKSDRQIAELQFQLKDEKRRRKKKRKVCGYVCLYVLKCGV